ncbi:methylenetetrahydrofolate reductase [NAD(P)H] [Actinomarinicola tropica]|uniref:Methylenetetrahydrofolate reductase n=1 Tax=Actinomarinicola tropica TaxID=2789776 RepID=A0A5Q2RJ89_9ACTN|nr:methylenetetrahydrofolate reductase [NAD(P)H] [Actinomarinicola tropica]
MRDLLAAGPSVSFEFFPPKTDEAERQLQLTIKELEHLSPSFVSVTYGAGGSTRERTRDIVIGIERDTSLTAMAHLTCVGHRRHEITELLEEYEQGGVSNILALAGDPPTDGEPAEGDFAYALELVELVREAGDFSVGVAAHPEGHPRSPDRDSDLRHLAAKLTAADFGVTQFFFRAEDYLRMRDGLVERGCDTPVIPGIMPVTNARQVQRFAELSGAAFPADLAARLESVADDAVEVRRIGVEVATELCRTLLDEGVPGLHFYTLNRSTATREIAANLGLARP